MIIGIIGCLLLVTGLYAKDNVAQYDAPVLDVCLTIEQRADNREFCQDFDRIHRLQKPQPAPRQTRTRHVR